MEQKYVTEGSTTFQAPIQDENTHFPPGTAPVFYNTKMELNRDATVLLLAHLKPSDYLDVMAATGVRGLRVSNEVKIPVTINDRDPLATEMIQKNAEMLGGDITVTNDDANHLMCGKRFDAIDLDPFGSPAPFLDAAARAARNYLFVTATDTAPLCGAHLKAGMRRYFSTPKNTEYHSEVGLRIMMGAVAKELVKYDLGMKPILSFARSHYVRSHVKILPKVVDAEDTMANIGFIMQCPKCLYRFEEKGKLLHVSHICPHCGIDTEPIGPMWMGKLSDKDVVKELLLLLPSMEFGTKRAMEKLLRMILDEPDTCSFYDYHVIARAHKVSPPPMDVMIDELRAKGFEASKTHLGPTGVKTTAPLDVLENWIVAWDDNLKSDV